jgi:hypothetical protein
MSCCDDKGHVTWFIKCSHNIVIERTKYLDPAENLIPADHRLSYPSSGRQHKVSLTVRSIVLCVVVFYSTFRYCIM